MVTLSVLRARIASNLSNDNLISPTSAQIDTAINGTIDYYQNDYFWFQQGTSALVTVADIPTLSGLPSDFHYQRHPNSLVLEKDSRFHELIQITPQQYDRRADTNSSSTPRYYTYRDGAFELYPYPDAVYTVNLYYYKSYVDLSEDGDSNDFTTNAVRLIEDKTLGDLFLDYRGDPESTQLYFSKAKDEHKIIKRQTYNRVARGKIIPESIIDSYPDYRYHYH